MNINSNKVLAAFFAFFSAGMFVTTVFMFNGADTQRIWRCMLINYLFFTSAAAGLVVWPAIVIICNGKWMGSLEKICWTGISFALPSILALIILWIGSSYWAPWLHMNPPKIWLNNNFLFLRNLILLVGFWIMAFIFLRNRYRSNGAATSGWFILIYAITFSFTGFDLVMTLEPRWYSMMTGGYFFISGLYIAAAAWCFLSIILEEDVNKKAIHDIGNLMLTFCILTSYTMYSQLLPIWYENQPNEAIFLVPRMNLAWKSVSQLLLGLVYLGPIVLLLNREVKKNMIYMGIVSLMIFAGMWIERWWLVSAVFETKIFFGWDELAPTLGFAGMFAAGILYLKHQYSTAIRTDDEGTV